MSAPGSRGCRGHADPKRDEADVGGEFLRCPGGSLNSTFAELMESDFTAQPHLAPLLAAARHRLVQHGPLPFDRDEIAEALRAIGCGHADRLADLAADLVVDSPGCYAAQTVTARMRNRALVLAEAVDAVDRAREHGFGDVFVPTSIPEVAA